jgi:hypothetical protein
MEVVPALLPMVMPPATFPVAVGANVTSSAALCPIAKVVLTPTPLDVNPDPVTSTLEIVTLAFPVLVNVRLSELLLPTTTLPKSRLFVLALSESVCAMPLPLAEIASGEFGASLAREIEPLAIPAELGANTTLNVALCPAAILIGTVSPDVLNPAPATLALEIVTVPDPGFCNVIVCELLDPVATAEKLALAGIADNSGCGVFVEGCGAPLAG